MTHHETLDRFFPAMFRDDRAALAPLVTDDIEWHAPPFAAKGFGELKGSERVLRFLTEGSEKFYAPGSFEMETELRAIEGDQAIVIAILRAKTAHGRPYSNRYAFGFRFRGERICEAFELMDSVQFQKQQAVR